MDEWLLKYTCPHWNQLINTWKWVKLSNVNNNGWQVAEICLKKIIFCFQFYYRPQGKVMFSQVFVCPQGVYLLLPIRGISVQGVPGWRAPPPRRPLQRLVHTPLECILILESKIDTIYSPKMVTCLCGWVVSKIHPDTLILTCLWTSKRALTKSMLNQ